MFTHVSSLQAAVTAAVVAKAAEAGDEAGGGCEETSSPPLPVCSCCRACWKPVTLAPLGNKQTHPSQSKEGATRPDRLGMICRQVGLGSPGPRPALAHLSPAPASAGDGGVLINSVLGEISTATLGWTSSHEHIFVNDAKSIIIEKAYPDTFPTDYIVREGIAALKRFKANGGGTVVDCTTVDLGRNVGLMAHCAEESGVNIICTTGCWIDVPVVFARSDPDALAALYIRDCTVGIEGTGIKAGIIKCAHESGITWERGVGFTRAGETTARACARAAKATGLPITTHTEVAERIGLAQCELFEEEGVGTSCCTAPPPQLEFSCNGSTL
jgi:hypothetical protein